VHTLWFWWEGCKRARCSAQSVSYPLCPYSRSIVDGISHLLHLIPSYLRTYLLVQDVAAISYLV